MRLSRFGSAFLFATLLAVAADADAQSTATLTQTVAQRHTLGVLTSTPASGSTAGSAITFGYILHTAGAPAPTSESVQFYDGATAIGSSQSITSITGSNLLPYSQISASNGWSLSGSAASLNPGSSTGPDGSSSSATQVSFPNTTSGTSGVLASVTGTAYATRAMTLSVWAQSASALSLTLTLADSPAATASSSNTCAVTSAWQRCTLTYTFPANAGTGFSAAFSVTGSAAQTVSLWGAQVESAGSAGPYVSTIGTARASGAQGGNVSFPYSLFHAGSHTITVVYGGDSNFVGSTSSGVALTIAKATPGIVLVTSPATTSAYGTPVVLAATLSGPAGNPTDLPTGTIQFLDGATSLGTGTLSAGVATVTLSGSTSLPAGSHSITAVYAGDSEFNSVTSSAATLAVTKVSSAVSIAVASSLNPSTYGDTVVLTIQVTSSAGAAIPTGSLAILDGATSLGTVTLNGAGAGSLTVPLFTAGTHVLTITYSGDGNYN